MIVNREVEPENALFVLVTRNVMCVNLANPQIIREPFVDVKLVHLRLAILVISQLGLAKLLVVSLVIIVLSLIVLAWLLSIPVLKHHILLIVVVSSLVVGEGH